MYLHIGANILIETKSIVAIYHIKSVEKTKEYQKLMEELKEKKQYYNSFPEEEKSLVITKEESKIKGYISNISSITLAKRAQMSKGKIG